MQRSEPLTDTNFPLGGHFPRGQELLTVFLFSCFVASATSRFAGRSPHDPPQGHYHAGASPTT
jgi:hypothetical protein